MKLPVALSIAGSDSGGGAGIQADLRAFAALGVHGTCAVTAVTAQDTVTVHDVFELPVATIRAQVDAVVADLAPSAAKTGMLSSAEIIDAVATAVRDHELRRLVVDPVMVAKGGARLLREDAVNALITRLLPLALVVTPNLPEAEVLTGSRVATLEDMRAAARAIAALGPRAVVVKGGHRDGDPVDILFDGEEIVELPATRIPTANTHGSGCTFSAAITAGLARGLGLRESVQAAKSFITAAVAASLEIGHGHGPVNSAFEFAGRPPGRSPMIPPP